MGQQEIKERNVGQLYWLR